QVSYLPREGGGEWAVGTCIQLHESERHQQMAELLTSVSAAMVSTHSERAAREAAIAQFGAAGLQAAFLKEPEEPLAREALQTGRVVFGGPEQPIPDRAWLPIAGPDGTEVLALRGGGLASVHAPTLALFARVVGSALVSARMIAHLEAVGAESKRQLADTQLLLDLARITAGTLELHSILDAACDFLVRLLDVSNAFILLYDQSARVLRGAAASRDHREFFRTVEIAIDNPGVAGTAARERRPIVVSDTMDYRAGRRDLVDRFGERALMALPLISRGELLGVVVIDDTRGPRVFAPELIQLAQASIGQLALSVANARLYESLRQSYSELAAARAEMVKRERLAALGELSAVVAHEVRNPLGVIFNAVSSLRRITSPEGDARMLLGIIAEESDRLNRIVGELLDFARPRALSLQLANLGRLVEESVDAAQAERSPGAVVRFDLQIPPDLPELPMDRHLLRQALVNVLVNAVQAMPQGGTVSVRARLEPAAGEKWARLEVSDQGGGIPPELVHRVFEPFFTTKARGTGLGLALVKRIVEDHRGEVQVRTDPGRGTTFIFRLPLASGREPR
ncbi:MAG: GAF domain-containing protein, partial [Myxococcaceae bacterium]|nr:GAF domain-containing protein [Myxococcaceae bacterium]